MADWQRSRGLIVLLTGLSTLGALATSFYAPSLPAVAVALSADTATTQLTMSFYLVAYAAAQLVYGPLSDRFGRRALLFVGLAIFIGSSVVCALATSIGVLIAARMAQAAGGCAGQVIARAVVRDLFPPRDGARVMAFIGTIFGLAPAFLPIAGGFLQVAFGWQSLFVAVALIAVALFVAAWTRLHETLPEGLAPVGFIRSYRRLIAARQFLGYTGSLAFCFGGLFAFLTEGPVLVIGTLGVSPDLYGLYAFGPGLAFAAGSWLAGRFTAGLGFRRSILIGLGICFVAGLGWLLPGLAGHFTVFAVLAPMVVYNFGMGIVFPNAVSGAIGAFPEIAGAASALSGASQWVAAAAASFIVALLPGATQASLGMVMVGSALLALASALVLRDEAD